MIVHRMENMIRPAECDLDHYLLFYEDKYVDRGNDNEYQGKVRLVNVKVGKTLKKK